MLISLRFCYVGVYLALVPSAIMDKRRVASTSDRSQHNGSKTLRSGRSKIDRLINELFEQEF